MGGRRGSFLCSRQSTVGLDPALMSPLIQVKLNFNGLILVTSITLYMCVCVLLHSQFPLQVERLLHIVVLTALADEGDIAADCHLILILLLQLKGALQVLIGEETTKKLNKKDTSQE